MEITITYNGLKLTVTGDLIKEEPANNITEYFEVNDIRDAYNNDIWDDFLEEDLEDIEGLALIAYKDNKQSNWETANV